jgi:hypothetical protein
MQIPIRKMSDREAQAELERLGGYQAYRAMLKEPQQPLAEEKPKGAAQVFFEHSEAIAKIVGVTVQELFQQDPPRYAQYKELLQQD